jgi:hypothetical protein
MQNRTVSYRIKPLQQTEHPENLYKRSPSCTASPDRSQVATPLTIYSIESPPPTPRSESSRPRQSPASRQQAAEAQAIAQRVQDTSGSSRLEFLLRRQQGKRYEHWQKRQPLMPLEHLAIAQRPDQHFQIVIRGTQTAFSRQVFATLEHCSEAAAELEQRFEIEGMLEFLDADVQEAVEVIVWAVVVRERVAVELARA